MFRVHEEFLHHPKVERLEALSKDPADMCAALGLWLLMGCDCRSRLTDGRFTHARLRKIAGRAERFASRLVGAGLWHKTDDGFEFHDWADVQETKEEITARRGRDRSRKRVGDPPTFRADSVRNPDGIQPGIQPEPKRIPRTLSVPSLPDPVLPIPSPKVAAPLRVAAAPLDLAVVEPDAKAAASRAWTAYAVEYRVRYGDTPHRNAKANTLLKRFVTLVPQAEAPSIAAGYVRSNNRYYVQRGHPLECLVADAQKICTEVRTGRYMTAHVANEADKQAGRADAYAEMLERMEREDGVINATAE